MLDFSKASVSELKAHVQSVLNEKNVQKYPQTLVTLFDDLQSAEFFKSELSLKRAAKIRTRIQLFVNGIKAKEYKTQAQTLNEDILSQDVLENKALIHASKVRRLAMLRENYVRREAELLASIQKSEGKIPYSQRKEFVELLTLVQSQAFERVENDEDMNDE